MKIRALIKFFCIPVLLIYLLAGLLHPCLHDHGTDSHAGHSGASVKTQTGYTPAPAHDSICTICSGMLQGDAGESAVELPVPYPAEHGFFETEALRFPGDFRRPHARGPPFQA